MGGGGAMRTVAKIAGFGVARSQIRGSSAAHPTEQSVWNAPRSLSQALSSSQGAKAAEVVPLHTTASPELNDWEFADGGDLIMEAGEPMPRVVFDAVPTFQEAKEATAELKGAIDKVYLSSDSSQCEGPSPGSQVSVLSPTYSEPETKSCVAISNPSVPKHALQAFQLLSTSPEAQTVVASLACDPNVWNAVMQNSAVNDFLQSHQKVAGFEAAETTKKVEGLADVTAVAGFEAEESPKKVEEESRSGNGVFDFMDFLQNIKFTITEMVSRMSDFFQNIFPTAEKEKPSADANGSTSANFIDNKIMGGTLMGLAMMVVMVVLLRRA